MSPPLPDGLCPEQELTLLRPLARQFHTLDAATAEIARLSAERTLPKGTIHVLSDVHGDDTKLRHVINQLVARLMRILYGLELTDLGPFRAVRRDLLLNLDMRERTYGWPVEMIVKAARHRARIVELPVSYRPRMAGRSITL